MHALGCFFLFDITRFSVEARLHSVLQFSPSNTIPLRNVFSSRDDIMVLEFPIYVLFLDYRCHSQRMLACS